ncbi:DUF1613-domain-containing protein [Fomitiporia mediterranea MF3/22]|uniref:DUF1613-domain-containing protein n=1 Tax=Fomitiporia mediterranea (strain MF3/22) TaxID=694068 RepID=UPI00044093B7|nr:DUF1613-domain-containing protein [Fomitiporia mediterranea MF3/22]EJC98366.1 DUF1613-domain-containing protein [Fomitiporia mediterranea MF3/22]
MSQHTRPSFTPLPCTSNDPWEPLKFTTGILGISEWVPTSQLTLCAHAPQIPLDKRRNPFISICIHQFEAAISQLVHHPEYNSTLILRSEVIEDSAAVAAAEYELPQLQGFRLVRNLRRRLLPRRPGRDPPIEQDCTFYAASNGVSCGDVADSEQEHVTEDDTEALVNCLVLTPKLEPGRSMPYYHPAVFHIAFRYLTSPRSGGDGVMYDNDDKSEARLRIEVVLRPGAPDPKDINSRLYRTCLSLLETIHRYGWGISTNYQKQVHHDCLVSREEYQDLYLVLRERHKHLVGQWHENTDPLKHVFEDIGIATFLMLLWKQNVHDDSASSSESVTTSGEVQNDRPDSMPWHDWPRPRSFLDFGCGNGLLVRILLSEGYVGEGIDLRARNSWQHYPPQIQAHLHVHALNPLDLSQSQSSGTTVPSLISNRFFTPGTFVIANHADELSPWTPVLATLTDSSGFLSIPCCPWSFDAQFHRSQLRLKGSQGSERETAFAFSPPDGDDPDSFVESLRLGGVGNDAGKSRYAAYRIWLACLGIQCGWAAETETLRIPSTRNWALVGRKRCGNRERSIVTALAIIEQVHERGLFKTRRPEGKAGDH